MTAVQQSVAKTSVDHMNFITYLAGMERFRWPRVSNGEKFGCNDKSDGACADECKRLDNFINRMECNKISYADFRRQSLIANVVCDTFAGFRSNISPQGQVDHDLIACAATIEQEMGVWCGRLTAEAKLTTADIGLTNGRVKQLIAKLKQ